MSNHQLLNRRADLPTRSIDEGNSVTMRSLRRGQIEQRRIPPNREQCEKLRQHNHIANDRRRRPTHLQPIHIEGRRVQRAVRSREHDVSGRDISRRETWRERRYPSGGIDDGNLGICNAVGAGANGDQDAATAR